MPESDFTPSASEDQPDISRFQPPPSRHAGALAHLLNDPLETPPQWMWEAMEPPDRRDNLERLHEWITWAASRYCEPPADLNERVPPCWFLHPGPLDRLTGLYVEWMRVYQSDGELPIPSFFDALDRHSQNLGFSASCLKRRHGGVTAPEAIPEWRAWLESSEFATAPAKFPPFATRPNVRGPQLMEPDWLQSENETPMILSGSEVDELLKGGDAERLGDTPAVFYDGDWWFGDENTYIRVLDPDAKRDMEEQAKKLNAAEQALQESKDDDSQ